MYSTFLRTGIQRLKGAPQSWFMREHELKGAKNERSATVHWNGKT
jgi:hypothetical protein